MADIKITTEDREEKPITDDDIKSTLKKADDYEKLKAENDKMEAEFMRQQELRAKIAYGGKADAGEPNKSQEDLDNEEAAKILKPFQPE